MYTLVLTLLKYMPYFALFLFLKNKTKQNSRTIKKYQAFNEVLQ